MSKYFQPLIEQLSQRSAEATLSILGVSNPALREFLSKKFNQAIGSENNFLADPVFEHIFGWEEANIVMDKLAGSLIERELIEAMHKPPKGLDEYAFRKDWKPYQHQYLAWQKLAQSDPQSIVITSGTGSGKTECFMVPVLNDLVREYQVKQQPLVGVQALFIYPLNALINSQRDRLRAWTGAFDNNIRFCLYNGNTQESVKASVQSETPNEILSRKLLRSEPAPLLVTNSTMLEYMLVRQVDAPILEKSQGSLRWIILDEAHTYIGSQAAELSLLLRRVLHGFGVSAENIRFIATSATIGDKDNKSLQRYLADLAGISEDRVTVIGGKREVPDLAKRRHRYKKNTAIEEMMAIDSGEKVSKARYQALSDHPISREMRGVLTQGKTPLTLSTLSNALFPEVKDIKSQQNKTLAWLDLCTGTVSSDKSKPFLPIRGHLFHQVINGLWCCVDSQCACKSGTALAEGWGFGVVYSQRRERCECGAPVYELVFCSDCNEPHLQAYQHNNKLIQVSTESVDEFSLQVELELEGDEQEVSGVMDSPNTDSELCILSYKEKNGSTYSLPLSLNTNILGEVENSINIHITESDDSDSMCGHCGFTGSHYAAAFRRCLLGTPFYVSNTVPTLLEFCQDGKDPQNSPARGRRLITFTDSRQGTARLAVKIQQDSERNRLRGLIYELVSRSGRENNADEYETLVKERDEYLRKAEEYKAIGLSDDFFKLAKIAQDKLEKASKTPILTWKEIISELQANNDISRDMLNYYRGLNPSLFPDDSGANTLAKMLLLREFYTRPKRQNSLESLGLVSIQYIDLETIKKAPNEWVKWKLSLNDWHDFLKLCLDFCIRTGFVSIPHEWINWMGVRISSAELLPPDSEEKGRRFPLVRKGRNHRLVRMLAYVAKIDIENKVHHDEVNQVMRSAWNTLTQEAKILTAVIGSSPTTYQMKLEKIAFSSIEEAWVCPITNRLLDTTLCGVTPYLPYSPTEKTAICNEVKIPTYSFQEDFDSHNKRLGSIREWINNQPEVIELRKQNLWTDLSDRIIEGGVFFRAAEHSAQQSAKQLQKFEAQFKAEKLNVLSCSTTMEMGVDIGGISSVAMNNVPPHPANYLQRAGRAGRRQETRALAFTICKDNPHERSVFSNPLWPFTARIKAPYITLNSDRIVQRHINSLVFGYFLRNKAVLHQQEATKITTGWFFSGSDNEGGQVKVFAHWLKDFEHTSVPDRLGKGLSSIISKTVLKGVLLKNLLNNTAQAIQYINDKWLDEYTPLINELKFISKTSENDPYKRRVERDIERLTGEYLLSELATRGFLPGYGFPTGIASFDPYSVHDYQKKFHASLSGKREDNRSNYRDKPGRGLSMAIREYAPGSNIVLNGLSYRSAGITLNWHIPNGEISETQKLMTAWRCHHCGMVGHEQGSKFSGECTHCGADLKLENILEFIEPAGFAVDFYSSPTTDVSTQTYIPVQDPWITAHEELRVLPNPKTGKFRVGTQGDIFYHSSGESGNGYAICLICGRSESLGHDKKIPESLKHHKRLRGKQGKESDALCAGDESNFSIKSNLHLGFVDHTDVFELYLKEPSENLYLNHEIDECKKIAWTLAVVLRQSLADILGINADELGYAVKPTVLDECKYPIATIVIFDDCSGGSGFSSTAHYYFSEMFTKAKSDYLQCSCKSVCQNCLLSFDTRFHVDYLDRQLALDFLSDAFINQIGLPQKLKVLGNNSIYTVESIWTEIRKSAANGATQLKVFLHGPVSDWDLGESNLLSCVHEWKNIYSDVVLVIDEDIKEYLPEIIKEDLWVLSRLGITIALAKRDLTEPYKETCILIQSLSATSSKTIACINPEVATPNVGWLNSEELVLISADDYLDIPITKIVSDDDLKPLTGKGDVEIEVLDHCNGSLNDFSEKFWSLITSEHKPLQEHFSAGHKLVSISYSDRYLFSPWTVLLIVKLVLGLKKEMKDSWGHPEIHIESSHKASSDYQRKGLFSDWVDDKVRLDVIEGLFGAVNESCTTKLSHKPPHGRFMHLKWNGGQETIIRFDQGISYWACANRASWLDNLESIDEQVDSLLKLSRELKVKNYSDFATQIFVKDR